MRHRVRVGPLPDWIDAERLLGGEWALEAGYATAERDTAEAADVSARLRGLGLGGHALVVDVVPALKRPAVRDARTEDARRRRDTTPGFLRKGTHLDPEGKMSLTAEALATIACPVLVAVGTEDVIGGAARDLAALIPGAEALEIVGRDHMKAVGDRSYKDGVLAFLRRRP